MQEQKLNNFFAGEYLEAGSPIAVAMSEVFVEFTKKYDEVELILHKPIVLNRPCAQGSSNKYTFHVVVLPNKAEFFFNKVLFDKCLEEHGEECGKTFNAFDKALLYYLRSTHKEDLTEEAIIIAATYKGIIRYDDANAASIAMF